MTTTTMGQLVSQLFDRYERTFHDEELAALATQAMIEEILKDSRTRGLQRRRQR
jgi:hypothetical protein